MKRVFIRGEAEKLKNYIAALTACGAEPVVSMDLSLASSCDGLLLPGGGDVDPAVYGQENCGSNPPDKVRDEDELALFALFRALNKPIFGICRGHQMINVALGGTLVQDLPDERHRHDAVTDTDRIHKVQTTHPLLADLYGESFVSNSAHHQAIDRLGEGLSVTCVSDEGVIEGIVHENGQIFAVQFHPERMAFALRREDADDGAGILRLFVSML